jgi:hypothetical protein
LALCLILNFSLWHVPMPASGKSGHSYRFDAAISKISDRSKKHQSLCNHCATGALTAHIPIGEYPMKKFACAIAALACLSAAPFLATPAAAQIVVGVDRDGPAISVGHEDRRYRDHDRGRHYGSRERGDCRDVTVRRRHSDGSVSVTTSRRCD